MGTAERANSTRAKRAAEVALEATAEMIKSVEAQDVIIRDTHKVVADTREMAKAALADAAEARSEAGAANRKSKWACDEAVATKSLLDRLDNGSFLDRLRWLLTGTYPN